MSDKKNEKRPRMTKKQKKRLIIVSVIVTFLFIFWSLFTQSLFYINLVYKYDQIQEQKERDRLWGHLDYSGDDILSDLAEEFVIPNYDPVSELELDYDELLTKRSNVYQSSIGNGLFMNEMGGTGDVSFLRITIYSFENTSIGGVDIAMHVYDIASDVVAFAERAMELILPTGYQEIIDKLNDIDFRGGEFFLDERKVVVDFNEEGITFLFYGKGDATPKN